MHLFGYDHHHDDHPWKEAPPWAIEIRSAMALILRNQEKLMAAIDDLQAAVTAEDTVIDSAIALIQGIPALIAAAGVDPVKLAALQKDITDKTTALAAAVVAGTPAATPPATPPV